MVHQAAFPTLSMDALNKHKTINYFLVKESKTSQENLAHLPTRKIVTPNWKVLTDSDMGHTLCTMSYNTEEKPKTEFIPRRKILDHQCNAQPHWFPGFAS